MYPAHTPTTVRVSDPALCLCQRSAGLTDAPRTTGTPKNHLSMTIHFYSHACSCVCPLILVMCIYVGLLLLGAGCWAAYGLSGDLLARDAAISHYQSPTSGLDSHNLYLILVSNKNYYLHMHTTRGALPDSEAHIHRSNHPSTDPSIPKSIHETKKEQRGGPVLTVGGAEGPMATRGGVSVGEDG